MDGVKRPVEGPGFTLIWAYSRKNLWDVVKPKDRDVEEAVYVFHSLLYKYF